MTDPIADMLSRIQNGVNARQDSIDMPHSGIKEKIAAILASEGFVGKVEVMKRMEKKFIRIALKFTPAKKGVISGFRRVSRPGGRVYTDARSLPRVHAGFGTAVISTSSGLMTDEEARSKKLGGEVLFYVW